MSNIVPFGKHKGKSVEALLDDREYLDWLLQQGWFQQRYGNLYQIVINNGVEPSETPEHNAMQIKFLDEEYRLKFAYAATGARLLALCDATEIKRRIDQIEITTRQVSWFGASSVSNSSGLCFRDYKDKVGTNLLNTAQLIACRSPVFETTSGGDVRFCVATGVEWSIPEQSYVWTHEWPSTYEEFIFCVEIKPSIGDDYPAVLRQIKRNKTNYLFIRSYTGIGATKEQFVKFFDSQGVKVVFETDVDAVVLPPFDREIEAAQ